MILIKIVNLYLVSVLGLTGWIAKKSTRWILDLAMLTLRHWRSVL